MSLCHSPGVNEGISMAVTEENMVHAEPELRRALGLGDALNVREMMFTVLIFYVCLASLFAWGMKLLEYSLRVPGIGQGA